MKKIPAETADLLYGRYLLAHLADPVRALRAWMGAVRRGGRVMVQETARLTSPVREFRRYYELLARLREWEPELVVLSGLMRLLPAQVVAAYAPAIVNTHPAYLPEFPGAHGVRDALAAGVTQTGASVIVVDSGVDSGPVLAQERIPVLPDDTEHSLHERIKPVERRLLIDTVRREEPHLFDESWAEQVQAMIEEAVECESAFADDVLSGGVVGLTRREMRQYLEYVADQRLRTLHLPVRYHARNPFSFMELQDVQELTNFFERRVSAYQTAVQGHVAFDEAF